jgi:hypothetical protein
MALAISLAAPLAARAEVKTGETTLADGSKSVTLLDQAKGTIERLLYDPSGALHERALFDLYTSGRVAFARVYTPQGRLKWTESFLYDKNGMLTQSHIHNADGFLFGSIVVKLDEHGKPAGTRLFDASGQEISSADWDKLKQMLDK